MQDHEIAQSEAKALFEASGIVAKISEPCGTVHGDWPCIEYQCKFTNGATFATEYRLGIGHVKWPTEKVEINTAQVRGLPCDVANTLRAGVDVSRISDKHALARAAALFAKMQKVFPAHHEVIAAVCREALEATETTFEDWTGNFGYDSDSIRARDIYDFCRDQYAKLLKIMPAETVRQFAELGQRF